MWLELRAVGVGGGAQAIRPVAAGACRPGKGHWRVLSTGEASAPILFLKSARWLLCGEPG